MKGDLEQESERESGIELERKKEEEREGHRYDQVYEIINLPDFRSVYALAWKCIGVCECRCLCVCMCVCVCVCVFSSASVYKLICLE